ncbi:unnamed protein product [Blepharisma stoltei]|uniref:C3H1-type domain-containing protein n=1 Tax=Blepharisma stoltei TaxID=1481888 RepID=A0AAU9K8I4_9CILI|nr:unnamed protein product [Blepharisma stoltei]
MLNNYLNPMLATISKNLSNIPNPMLRQSSPNSNSNQDNPMSIKAIIAAKKKATETDFKAKYKTEMCKNWEIGCCEFGDQCAFAHGEAELRSKTGIIKKYKTKKCKQFYEQGYCIYGGRCQFRHRDASPETAESSPIPCKMPDKFSSIEVTKRRLPIFIDLESREI